MELKLSHHRHYLLHVPVAQTYRLGLTEVLLRNVCQATVVRKVYHLLSVHIMVT